MLKVSFCAAGLLLATAAHADVTLDVFQVSTTGVGQKLGTITLSESAHGVVVSPKLTQLPPGIHGFHVHQNGSCQVQTKDGKPVAAGAAGDHYDPAGAKKHSAPWSNGHLGDMPPLYVDGKGIADQPLLAPRLKMSELQNKALVIHAGGDNFSDSPEPLGGGGERIACGVVGGGSKKN